MGEVRYTRDHQPTPLELQALQMIADGVNLLGRINRARLKRRHWHRLGVWVRWSGRTTLELGDLSLIEDRTYRGPEGGD